jgi:metal-sulfur cluster biosynthetic enzyme
VTDSRYNEHSDTTEEKLRLLRQAYAAKNYDVAMSLAASLRDTLSAERLMDSDFGPLQVGPDEVSNVADLPKAWSEWADGWKNFRSLTVTEQAGIDRVGEPVDVTIGFRVDQVTDPRREVRVAVCLDDGRLCEVVSQIYGESRRGDSLLCNLVFLANVPAHGRADFLVFHGAPQAELPDYTTDLRVTGEGYGLDIANHHFVASLSRQMGQLERLTYTREHGLELFAGGKSHGEPPVIDWGHDYVDKGNFQKLRIRNWAACPNYEVVRGPLCVRVRRWGFPHSPIHPLLAPSRMHMDISYVFYAGLPYFLKEGRFDMVKDFSIDAMRDDEWVFSGYSFDHCVWIDGSGRLHEGPVSPRDFPTESQNDIWGVGFYHSQSRDAFIALRLVHEANGVEGPAHGGVPQLNYVGHGQLWSRYPANGTEMPAGSSIRERNAYIVAPYPEDDPAGKIEGLRRELLNPLHVECGEPIASNATKASGSLARPGETSEMASIKREIWRTLREVRDEQFHYAATFDRQSGDLTDSEGANIVDMGYVYDVRMRQGVAAVLITMPHRGRPVFQYFVTKGGGRVNEGIYERLLRIDGVRDVVVDITWDPPWTPSRMTDAGRRAMRLSEPAPS